MIRISSHCSTILRTPHSLTSRSNLRLTSQESMPCLLFKRRRKDRADEKKAKAATKTATKAASTKKGKRNSPAVEEASSVEEEAQESSSESGSSRGETEEQSNKRKNRLTTSRLLKLVSHLKCPSLEAPRRPRRILHQKIRAKTTKK